MTIVTLRGRPVISAGPSSTRSQSASAALVREQGDLRVTIRDVPPGKAPRKSRSSRRGPVEWPKHDTRLSQSGPSVSFGAPEEDMMSITASEEDVPPAEAEDSAAQSSAARASTPAPPPSPSQGTTPQQGRRASRRNTAQPAAQALPKGRPAGRQGDPDTGNLEMEEIVLRAVLTSPPPPPGEGRGVVSSLLPLAYGSVLERCAASSVSGSEPHFANAGKALLSLGLPHPGCPTVGTFPTVPLIPLARQLEAWLVLPSPSRWLIQTVRLGYAIQFAKRPPKFRGIHFTSVQSDTNASVLLAEIAILLAKDAIEPVPLAEMKAGFYSPYFIVPKKSGGLRPILDLQALNRCSPPNAFFFAYATRISLKLFRCRTAVPLKYFQRLLGHMAAAAAVTPLGLLHMRPLQHWLHDRIPRWAWHRGTFRVSVTPECRLLFSPWSDPAFLRAGIPLGQVSRHVVVNTNAVCNGQAASGSWTGPRPCWHVNCLELLAVFLALWRFLPMLRHKHVLVRMDNTAAVVYINHQGGLRSRRMSQLACHLLLWSQTRLKSLRAYHIPGELNRAANALSRQLTHPGEWRLHPQVVQLIWSRFSKAQVDLFASPESSHCQLFYSLTEAPLSRGALAYSWQSMPFPQEDEEQVLLVAPYWPSRTCPSLENSPEERTSFSGDGHDLAPTPRPVEPPRVAPGRDAADLAGLPQAVVDTITQARAPSTRQAYALKWGLFVDWCSSRREDPQKCLIGVVLAFLQEGLERRLSPSTLKVYVATIAASLGKHHLVTRFLKDHVSFPLGNSPAPFEPLGSTVLLTALASIKRVGDLQAFSVNEACLEFGPADSHVILRPRPGYVPKVPTTPFRDQVVNLQALPPEEADPALALLCPVRALRIYVDRTRGFRRSEQLFVCFGGQQKGNAVSKQRLAHWVVDVITLAYESQDEPCPLGVRAHSTRSVASSYALAHSTSLAGICRAAG
ncbi:hypothetical protein M9458_008090 [Cirrhinus mrigala]|uniref:Uncharacterized protein n=1 Tax=Cirrhinus mrigala TaxID=683832 RepID=A0ABD0R871_CIRMR